MQEEVDGEVTDLQDKIAKALMEQADAADRVAEAARR